MPSVLPNERQRVLRRVVPLNHLHKVQFKNLCQRSQVYFHKKEHQRNQIHFHGILLHLNIRIMKRVHRVSDKNLLVMLCASFAIKNGCVGCTGVMPRIFQRGAKIWFSGYYKCQISLRNSFLPSDGGLACSDEGYSPPSPPLVPPLQLHTLVLS